MEVPRPDCCDCCEACGCCCEPAPPRKEKVPLAGAEVLGAAPKRPWDCGALVDCANIEVDEAAAVEAAPKSEDCCGCGCGCDCVVCADEMSNIDLRFAGCSALAPNPRLPNGPPPPPAPEDGWDDPNMFLSRWLVVVWREDDLNGATRGLLSQLQNRVKKVRTDHFAFRTLSAVNFEMG